jgi:hypothetical protein
MGLGDMSEWPLVMMTRGTWNKPARTGRTWLEVDVGDFELPTGLTDAEVLAEMPTHLLVAEIHRRLDRKEDYASAEMQGLIVRIVVYESMSDE